LNKKLEKTNNENANALMFIGHSAITDSFLIPTKSR